MSRLPLEISPIEAKTKLGEAGVRFIDVREPQEYSVCRIEGSELIPMGEIPGRFQDLDGDSTLIVICHHGVRSLSVVDWLRRQGIENCQSMAGGIDRWSVEVDAGVPRY